MINRLETALRPKLIEKVIGTQLLERLLVLFTHFSIAATSNQQFCWRKFRITEDRLTHFLLHLTYSITEAGLTGVLGFLGTLSASLLMFLVSLRR